jgi:hypothetical protein
MKRFIMGAIVGTVALASGNVFADNMRPAADHNPNMPAVVTDDTNAQIAPAAGRNSFTQKQATVRLQDQGYSRVSTLKADADGIWRGTAMKNGVKHNVAVDYQGNVRAQ